MVKDDVAMLILDVILTFSDPINDVITEVSTTIRSTDSIPSPMSTFHYMDIISKYVSTSNAFDEYGILIKLEIAKVDIMNISKSTCIAKVVITNITALGESRCSYIEIGDADGSRAYINKPYEMNEQLSKISERVPEMVDPHIFRTWVRMHT